jgi:hypothetical protein
MLLNVAQCRHSRDLFVQPDSNGKNNFGHKWRLTPSPLPSFFCRERMLAASDASSRLSWGREMLGSGHRDFITLLQQRWSFLKNEEEIYLKGVEIYICTKVVVGSRFHGRKNPWQHHVAIRFPSFFSLAEQTTTASTSSSLSVLKQMQHDSLSAIAFSRSGGYYGTRYTPCKKRALPSGKCSILEIETFLTMIAQASMCRIKSDGSTRRRWQQQQ